MEKNCAFQYYICGAFGSMVEDKIGINLTEAKDLWNKYYSDMLSKAKSGVEIEVAIWVNMDDDCDYKEAFIHLQSPEAEGECLIERVVKKFPRFNN